MTPHARIYFSFRSPFSWLAIERLHRALPQIQDLAEFIPYWEPAPEIRQALNARGAEVHYVPMSKAKHLYILQDVKRLAYALGLPLAWPVDLNPSWELPHLGWLQACRCGAGADFYSAVVSSRWHRGENICDERVIRAAAASVGLDGDMIVGAATNPEIQLLGVDCLARAHEDDIFGVPYFLIGWERFWGVDRVDEFLRAFLAAAENPSPSSGVPPVEEMPGALRSQIGAYDADTPGGCG